MTGWLDKGCSVLKTKTIVDNLAQLQTRNEKTMVVAIHHWLAFATEQIQHDLKTKFAKDVTSELTDWQQIEKEGVKATKPATLKIMQTGGNAAYEILAVQGSFSVLNVKAVKAAEKFTANLVTNVTDKTKAGIRTYIKEGIKQGKSMPKIARELRPLVGLTKPQTESIINYRRLLEDKGLKAPAIDKKVQRYADKTHRKRMNDIARTETARAQNIGYCQGLGEVGVTQAEFHIAPTDACDDCIARNGTRYPVEEAEGIIPVHPKCRCDMLPVVDDKALTHPVTETPETLAPTISPTIPGPEGMDYEAVSTAKQISWEDALTAAQLTSIDEYTAGETAKILAAQRKVSVGIAPSKLSTADKVWYGHAVQVESALEKAPGFKGQVWRGMTFKSDKTAGFKVLDKKLASKKPFTFDTTTSFTGSKDFASLVTHWDTQTDDKVKVMVRMKKAPKRSAYLGNLSGVEDEAEILVSVRTRYKVVGRTEKVVGKTRYIQYELDEVISKVKPKPKPKPKKFPITTQSPISPKVNGLKLTKANKESVKYYTSDGYRNVNAAQRGWLKGSPYEKEFLHEATKVEKALLKLPGYNGTSYRFVSFGGSKKDRIKFLKNFQPNKLYQAKQFLSTSTNRKFIRERFGKGEYTEFVIKGKSGRNVANLVWDKNEREVLFLKNSLFKVDKVSQNIIYLTEL